MLIRLATSVLLVLTVLLPHPVWAAVVCGTATTSVTEADPQTVTFTPDAGSNRIVVVVGGVRDSTNPTNTINGVSSSAGGTWTQYALDANGASPVARAYIYYSTDFADGSQTISVDYTIASPTQGTVGVFTCTGVNTSNPWRATRTTNSGTATSGSMSVTSAANELVLDVISLSGAAGDTLAVGASQTEQFNLANGGDNLDTGSSTEAGAGSVTMSWSWTNSRPWVSVGGSLQEAIVSNTRVRRVVELP